MNILFVITGLGVGGAERQVVELADVLCRRGHRVAVAYLTGAAALLPQEAGVRAIGFSVSKSVGGVLRAVVCLRRLIKEWRPDVVHSHMFHANLIARVVRLAAPVPRLICTSHSTNEGGRLRMAAYRLTDRLADGSTNVSREAVKAFELRGAVPPGRMAAVVNGIDTARFRPDAAAREAVRARMGIRADEKIVLAVGRLAPAKDYPNLLHAFARLRQADAAVRLWIAGEGALLEAMQALAGRLGIADRTSFLGLRKDVPDLMNAADVFALSSAWEGFGLVVGEAMACEKTVVATDCGGVREVLGDCGHLVPPGDSGALASALARVLQGDPALRGRMGERARRRVVSRFSLEGVADGWERLYRNGMGSHR